MERVKKRIEEENKKKEYDLKFKQEDNYIKRLQKNQNILLLNRLKEYTHAKKKE